MKPRIMKLTASLALVFVSLPVLAAEFHAYAPSAERQALLTVAIEQAAGPTDGSSAADPVHATPLGFKGSTIVAHPSQPWLYVSGAAATPGGPNAAVVRLGADGLPESVDACTLDSGYCWLSIDRTERFLLGCDYGTGKVDIFPLDAAGKPGRRCGGADQGRKEGHCVQPTPDNRFVYVPHVKGWSNPTSKSTRLPRSSVLVRQLICHGSPIRTTRPRRSTQGPGPISRSTAAAATGTAAAACRMCISTRRSRRPIST